MFYFTISCGCPNAALPDVTGRADFEPNRASLSSSSFRKLRRPLGLGKSSVDPRGKSALVPGITTHCTYH